MDLPRAIGMMGPPPRPGGRPSVSVIVPPLPDGDDRHLAAHLGDIVALLGRLVDAGERIYLHCTGGLNRAPTAAIAYLHAREGLSLEAARDTVKRARHCVPYMRALQEHFGGVR